MCMGLGGMPTESTVSSFLEIPSKHILFDLHHFLEDCRLSYKDYVMPLAPFFYLNKRILNSADFLFLHWPSLTCYLISSNA